MSATPLATCTICGESRSTDQVWFLLAESHWDDKLKILHFQEEVAHRSGVHRACCPSHVEELVVHWMTVGSLDVPFAARHDRWELRRASSLPLVLEADTSGARLIGELAVHRESVGRALEDNPDSLQIILDELLDTLEREAANSLRLDPGDGVPGWVRQM